MQQKRKESLTMFVFRRNLRKRKKATSKIIDAKYGSLPEDKTTESSQIIYSKKRTVPLINDFSVHMSKYIGQTVTIFVNGGDMAGAGFTGILTNVNDVYARMILRIGPIPLYHLKRICSFYPACRSGFRTFAANGMIDDKSYLNTFGTVTYIQFDKIIAFIHNCI